MISGGGSCATHLRGRNRWVAIFVLPCLLLSRPLFAQTNPPTSTGLSLAQTLSQLTHAAAGPEVGEVINLATSIEVATTPLATSAGGFAFKLDRSTGLEVRTATTFGPTFAERAITAGAGQMSFAVNLTSATYDKLDKLDLDNMQLASSTSGNPDLAQTGTLSLVLSSDTTLIQAVMGATDNFDIGVALPIVRVKLEGVAWVQSARNVTDINQRVGPQILTRTTGRGISTGMGDLALIGKYRFLRFGAKPAPDAPLEPDPGGLALLATVRLPTGSKENLRGLGLYRAMGTLVFSAGKGRFRPHANVGYELWSDGIDVVSLTDPTVTARNSFQYAAGFELEATPKLTLIVDFLSRQINGGGKIGFNTTTQGLLPGVSSLTYPRGLPEGFLKQSIVPGIKWNLKGNFLLSLNGITALRDNGLSDKFTPVVGLDWTF